VTRLSIGVQSLQPSVTTRLGRGHTVFQARALLEIVGQLGLRSWSFDLIFGVPGQTMAQLEADLAAIIDTAPPHVSLYGLTIEPGTPFASMEAAGTLHLPDDDTWRRQYDQIVQTLRRHGWERYEVSNFARPGHRGVHNDKLWRGGWYAGLGPGAHGFRPDGTRTTTEPDVRSWIADPAGRVTCPSAYEAAVDHLLSTLRHQEGTTHRGLWSASRHRLHPDALIDLDQAGLITCTNPGIRLTEQGFALADGVLRRLSQTLYP
jgi:oxygen-independent coproporphyrinogen-3 oxidase